MRLFDSIISRKVNARLYQYVHFARRTIFRYMEMLCCHRQANLLYDLFLFCFIEFDGISAIELVITNEPKQKSISFICWWEQFCSHQSTFHATPLIITNQHTTTIKKSIFRHHHLQINLLIFSFLVIYRVLKAPGGGSSDIFGGSIPSTPRSVKNNMASNIFGGNGNARNGNGKTLFASL